MHTQHDGLVEPVSVLRWALALLLVPVTLWAWAAWSAPNEAPGSEDRKADAAIEEMEATASRVAQRAELLCGPRTDPGEQRVPDRATLLSELADALRWISLLRDTEDHVHLGIWCWWQAELAEGLRRKLPAAGPPPVTHLPDPSRLAGASRGEIVEALGQPADGCWRLTAGHSERVACQQVNEVHYPFFHLTGQPGGGDELVVTYDETGTCIRALWSGTQ